MDLSVEFYINLLFFIFDFGKGLQPLVMEVQKIIIGLEYNICRIGIKKENFKNNRA